jgi:hypothetical protein
MIGNLVKQKDNYMLDFTFYIFELTEYPLFEIQSLERYETWGSYGSIKITVLEMWHCGIRYT